MTETVDKARAICDLYYSAGNPRFDSPRETDRITEGMYPDMEEFFYAAVQKKSAQISHE